VKIEATWYTVNGRNELLIIHLSHSQEQKTLRGQRKIWQGAELCDYCGAVGTTYGYDISCTNIFQREKYVMCDYPVVTYKCFPHNFAHYLVNVAASLGRSQSLWNQIRAPYKQKMADLHREFLLSSFFRKEMNVGGTNFPEALIQQTTVMVCPRFPLMTLLTDLFPLEFMTFGIFLLGPYWHQSHPC
jgi:hypothetical protein